MVKPIIYLRTYPCPLFPPDVIGIALAESGHDLATITTPNDKAARWHLATGSQPAYKAHYPQGYELVWAIDGEAGYDAARARNAALWDARPKSTAPVRQFMNVSFKTISPEDRAILEELEQQTTARPEEDIE